MPQTLQTSSLHRSPTSLRRLGLTVLLGLTAVATFAGSAFAVPASEISSDAAVAVEAPPAAEVPAGTPAAEVPAPISTSATPATTNPGPAPPPSTVPAASDPTAAAPAAEVPTTPAVGTTPAATVVDAPVTGPDQAPATPAARPDATAPANTTPARPTSDATLPGHPSTPANTVETVAPKVAGPARVTAATAIPTAPDILPTATNKTNVASGTPPVAPSLNLAATNTPSRSAAGSFGSSRPSAMDSVPPSTLTTEPAAPKLSTKTEATAEPALKLTLASGSVPGGGGDRNFFETLAGYFVPGALNNSGTGLLLLIPVALLLAAWAPPRVRILLSALRFAPGGLRVGYASVGLRPG